MVIVISNKYNSTEIPLNWNLEAVAISISFPKRIHIWNIYIPNSFSLDLQDFEDLTAQLPVPLILSGAIMLSGDRPKLKDEERLLEIYLTTRI